MPLQERLTSPYPKRILALDGGGARIIMSLGFLEEIERILRDGLKRPHLLLCDYFDLIGGTSAGALIASALATGMETRDVTEYALRFAGLIFEKKKWMAWEATYDEGPLMGILKDQFGDIELGDPSIRCGLCIVMKRADTRSTWPLTNHPSGQFYEANKHILLRNAIRASTAAPTYFVPIGFDVGQGEQAAFLDGGVSMANNPALQMFMLVTLSGYPFRWQTGAEKMLLTSIGTGYWQQQNPVQNVLDAKIWDWAWEVPMMLMDDASIQNELILQWLSKTPTARTIDMEIGNLSADLLTQEPMLHYLRYNVRLESDELCEMGLPDFGDRVSDFYDLSCSSHKDELLEIGRAAARCQVQPDHFPSVFGAVAQAH